MTKQTLTLISAVLASVIAVYILFLSKASWSLISVYWLCVAWKNWKEVADAD